MSEQQAAREEREREKVGERREKNSKREVERARGERDTKAETRGDEKLKIKHQSHSVSFFSNLAASGWMPCATLAASSETSQTRRDARGRAYHNQDTKEGAF